MWQPRQSKSGFECLAIEVFVFLHVGQVHEQVEVSPGQHLVDMGILIGHFELGGAIFRALRDDITGADDLGVGTF